MTTRVDGALSTISDLDSPIVTVGMPVYNGEMFVREAIESVLNQELSRLELLISDNASTDLTESICREYAERDSRVRYIRQASNIGGVGNFNYVLENARGKYFTWLAHDDSLDSTYLSTAVNYLEDHPDTVLCASAFRIVKDGNVIRTLTLEEVSCEKDWEKTRSSVFTFNHDLVMLFYGVYRREALTNHDIKLRTCFRGMANASEYSVLCRVALRGKIVSLPAALRCYRRHENSVARQENNQTSHLLRLTNYLYVIARDQVRVALLSDLTTIQKFRILKAVLIYDTPVIALRSLPALIPARLWRYLSRIRYLRAIRGKVKA